jgi:uncharacterized protein YrzB (UPF0473 family)
MCDGNGNCGCGSNEEYVETVKLVDENGEEREFAIITVFELDEQEYAVLVATDESDEEGVILRLEEEDGEEYLVDIDDDQEWERVVAAYEELVE